MITTFLNFGNAAIAVGVKMWIKLSVSKSYGFQPHEFVDHLKYRPNITPPNMNEKRWETMMKWLETRNKRNDWIEDDKVDVNVVKQLLKKD